jgi:hypothetical protein
MRELAQFPTPTIANLIFSIDSAPLLGILLLVSNFFDL